MHSLDWLHGTVYNRICLVYLITGWKSGGFFKKNLFLVDGYLILSVKLYRMPPKNWGFRSE